MHLSNLTRKGAVLGRGYVVRPESSSVVVVGGANMDIKARSHAAAVLHTSNPGTAVTSPGGVGRNIAENLARLGTPVQLVAPVGTDRFGDELVVHARACGIGVDHLVQGRLPTGTYLAVLDRGGDLLVAVSNMAATEQLAVADLTGVHDLVAHSDLLVLDGNLPVAPLGWLLDVAAAASVPVVLEPVSVAKAARLAPVLAPDRPVLAVTPNVDELEALVGAPVHRSAPALARAARSLHDVGVRHVWVRRGSRGSLLSTRADDGRTSTTAVAAPHAEVVDVTGAGDAMTAAFVHALLRGDAPPTPRASARWPPASPSPAARRCGPTSPPDSSTPPCATSGRPDDQPCPRRTRRPAGDRPLGGGRRGAGRGRAGRRARVHDHQPRHPLPPQRRDGPRG
ncbi:MAG TPA: carbohydrate kinase family protein [Dermatophilaceae bacterium]|nr:carbohydrate kinase family protein [Dermatophilaceae bacterium]